MLTVRRGLELPNRLSIHQLETEAYPSIPTYRRTPSGEIVQKLLPLWTYRLKYSLPTSCNHFAGIVTTFLHRYFAAGGAESRATETARSAPNAAKFAATYIDTPA
jgi:hypothetical protein